MLVPLIEQDIEDFCTTGESIENSF